MKLIEFMYRSQIPQLLKIIDMYNSCIELRRTLIGRQHQVFTSVNTRAADRLKILITINHTIKIFNRD